MAGGGAWPGAVRARLRRAVQRLLILCGLLVAAWLLGCAAQSAHADEIPVEPSRVVAETAVVRDAVEPVHLREPVGRVVRAVAEKVPHEEKATRDASPVLKTPMSREAPDAVPGVDTPVVSAVEGERRHQAQRSAPTLIEVDRPAAPASKGHVSQQVVQHDTAPLKAPERSDGNSVGGGSAMSGVMAAYPNVVAWAPAPPRASDPRAFGAVPPAVRTAADEPSFAPD